ncbi:MAG: sugar phosphate isomerase/epimerase [Verrucomicrobia bacterium]|nr:sugar phosphate isomerase/epimerase [Verrucomicrobiota bacterium]
MIISGIADEAGKDIDAQIRAHKELGWTAIELRFVNGKNVAADLPADEFEKVAEKVLESGLQVTGFASAIGNWSRNIRGDFALDVNELKTVITRMNRFGTKFIRTMSWVGDGVPENEWRDEGIRRYKELAKIAEDGGVFLAHENCTGWAGQSAETQRYLIEEVNSKNLVVLFDIGNTVAYGYNPWTYYQGVKDLIRYIHIKDCRVNPEGGKSADFTYPGEGDARVKDILTDFIASGYDGVVSIEPHVAAIAHDSSVTPTPEKMFESYLKYGRMLTEMVKQVKKG